MPSKTDLFERSHRTARMFFPVSPQIIAGHFTNPPQNDAALNADFHCGGGASMTIDFLHGFLAALMPSMLVLAWLLWREAPMDSDVDF